MTRKAKKPSQSKSSDGGPSCFSAAGVAVSTTETAVHPQNESAKLELIIGSPAKINGNTLTTVVDIVKLEASNPVSNQPKLTEVKPNVNNHVTSSSNTTEVSTKAKRTHRGRKKNIKVHVLTECEATKIDSDLSADNDSDGFVLVGPSARSKPNEENAIDKPVWNMENKHNRKNNKNDVTKTIQNSCRENTSVLSKAIEDDNPNLEWQLSTKKGNRKNRTLEQIEVKNTSLQEEIPYQKGNCNIKNAVPSENIIEEATHEPSLTTHLPNPKNDIPKSGKRDKLDHLKQADSDKEVISGNTKDPEIKLKPEIKNTSIQKSPGKKDKISLKKEKGNKNLIESSEKSQNIGDAYNTASSNTVTKDYIKNKEAHAEIKSAAVEEFKNMDKLKKKNQITEPPADYISKPVTDEDTTKVGHNPLEQRTLQEAPQKGKGDKKSQKGRKIESTKADIQTVVSNASGNTSKLTALAEIDKIDEINPESVVEKESKQHCDKLKLTQGKKLIKSVSKSNDDIVQLSCTKRSESNTSTVQIRNRLEDEDITTEILQDAVVETKQDCNEKTIQSFKDECSKISPNLQKQSTNPNTEEHILTQYTKTIADADTKIEKKPARSNKRNILKSKGTPKIEDNVYSNESKDKIIKMQETNPHELSIDSLLKEIDLVDAGKELVHEDNTITPTSKKSVPTKPLGTYPEKSITGQELHDLVIGVGTLGVIASTEIVPLTSTNTEQKSVKESLIKNIEITKIEDTKSATKTPEPVNTRTVEITTQIPQDKIDGSGKSPKKQKQNRKPSNNKTTTTPNQCTTPEALQTISNEFSIKNNETADTIDLEIPIVQLAKLFIQEIPQRPLDLKETPNESSEFVHLTEKGESPGKTKQAKRIRNQSKIVASLPNEICEDIKSSTEIVSPVSSPKNKKESLVKSKQRKCGKPSDISKPDNSCAIDAPQVLEPDAVTESNHLEPRIDICKKHPCPSYASKLSQPRPEQKEMDQPPKEPRKEVRSHDITILKGNTKSEQLINKDLQQENIIREQTAVLKELIRENITKDVSPTVLGDVLVNEDNEIFKSHLSKCENKAKLEIDEDKRKLLNLALNLIIEAAKPKSKQDENKKPLGLPTVLEVVTPEETVSQKSLESDKKIECKRIETSADILENADIAKHQVLREPADLPERPKTPDVFTMTEKQTKGRSSNKKRQNKIDKLNAGCSTKPNQSGNPAMPETNIDRYLENDEDFIEFKFKPRTIFLANACNLCKALSNVDCKLTLCQHCKMVSYCCESHRMEDLPNHQQICTVICEIASRRGGDHIYHNSKILGEDDFRNMRVQMVSICETAAKRTLQPFEREIVLFPRLCCSPNCREWRQEFLENCKACGQVSFCASNQEHLSQNHATWCQPYLLFCKIVVRQHQHGRINPALPARIFTTNYQLPNKMEMFFRDILKNNSALKDDCQLAALSQLATAPLTVLYAQQKTTPPILSDNYTIHLVGAELQFEADTLDKWEAFLLHLLPSVNYLKIIFIGPELNTENLPLDILSRIRMCKACRQTCRTVKFEFHCRKLYHEYVDSSAYTKPNIVCAFNPGLHRPMGYAGRDTWPDTIRAVLRQQVPFVVTAYTEHEIPLDLQRIMDNADRPVEILLPPQINPYASLKPDRNFISDDRAPLIFKNYYLLVIK